jgi:CheY-like chemotaxis protein
VLVVDDNAFNVYSLKLMLEEHFKLETETAFSGGEGIRKFEQRFIDRDPPFRIVFTDINMP